MAEGDCAAVDVYTLNVETGLPDHRQSLYGERFVEFDDVDVGELQPCQCERLGNRHSRTDAHDLRWHSTRCKADKSRLRLESELPRSSLRHHQRRRGPVAGLRRVAGGHRTLRMEDGFQFRERLE